MGAMKNPLKYLILILGILILTNCKQKSGIEYSFADVQVNKSDYYLTLPKDIKEKLGISNGYVNSKELDRMREVKIEPIKIAIANHYMNKFSKYVNGDKVNFLDLIEWYDPLVVDSWNNKTDISGGFFYGKENNLGIGKILLEKK